MCTVFDKQCSYELQVHYCATYVQWTATMRILSKRILFEIDTEDRPVARNIDSTCTELGKGLGVLQVLP